MEDKRFAHIAKDPKFRRIPKAQSKVKIDRRFQSMFTDEKFQIKYSTDKRGRPIEHHSNEDLKRYYEVSSEEESSENEAGKYVRAPKSSEESVDLDDKNLPGNVKEKLKDLNIDYARGESRLFSESSSDDEETDDEISDDTEKIDHRWGELDADAGQTEEATYRLAACNLDWDRIRALDLMVLFNSFLPPGGVIQSVVVYPSEFGKLRMQEEDVKGPIELVESSKNDAQSGEEAEEGSNYHMEKLRQYQLNRLKYFYAVITFDSASTANKIYTECDGMEYESSATKIDLRFIPDDMLFDDAPKDSCNKLPDKYEPRFFTTTALQQAKVQLTWDETNPDRIEFAEKINSGKGNDISERDLHNFLAGSSGEEDDEEDSEDSGDSDSERGLLGNGIDKYKALLQEIQEKEEDTNKKDIEMEISWGIDLKETTDKLMKEKQKGSEEQTPFQKYLEKRKEKRKEKKQLKKKSKEEDSDSDVPSDIDMNDPYFTEEFNNSQFKKKPTSKTKNKKDADETTAAANKEAELDLLLMNGEENAEKHFNLKKIQEQENATNKSKKKKNKKLDNIEDDFEINVSDNRFSAIFTSHHYNIDPTDAHYKKTKGMETLIQEKLKRRNVDVAADSEECKTAKKTRKDVELNVLVKNVKRNAQSFKKVNK